MGDASATVRIAAMRYLDDLLVTGSGTVSWSRLIRGFEFDGERVPLISQRGILRLTRFGPIPLSITTSAKNPYQDEIDEESG
jgi:hypothetical protein